MYTSLELSREHLHKDQAQSIAGEVHSCQSYDRFSESLRRVEVSKRIALGDGGVGFHALELKVCVFVEHQCLVPILEEREILELDEPLRDVVLVHEETGEEHERDNQDRRECHSELLVSEERRDDQGVGAGAGVDQDEDTHYGGDERV